MCICTTDSSSTLDRARPDTSAYQKEAYRRQHSESSKKDSKVSTSSKDGSMAHVLNVNLSFNEKLMRTEPEPRDSIYVYDYSRNETKRMKTRDLLEKTGSCTQLHEDLEEHKSDFHIGDQSIDQEPIPYSMRSIPIKTGTGGFGGGDAVVARVHVNLGLRMQRWLGMQKRLYIVDAIQ
ncbi:hypothetical protein AUEXF2481DRAFT_86387 [Aureobasidium subglaciale EXF-2481]|uniref:Uncharacterized protein n=1 Tax=Aureobasidium subglaciale (strain EXF-2481) TaxID=1043005 RepID=A0A074YKR0_AURSE|nr:uncharacterized protein AUEXF2481DRAFT_86387 [Aureobasidium subglaciale EXF-2481]KEQ98418.1 hypothetical protein AUEXF2481DRAFT_86387 [Aureobasidium subglaciale EXF-2481]